ncbi:hypothetical protein GCM10023084_17090 [Streptomyces lacrimifluminis]|uniref:Uncharacterized protein n=2 Tax=Streptomyces lacrimifluminis TaxID=1500077 RepID=A0A917KDY7_9ACTN|nr:hypothetical protein GCM10012282_01460 [Streptomyces lacrimifluminis]
MAEANFSAAVLPAHATPPHPMANPGYGKRDAPDQRPRTNHDFAHLPPREAAVAAYIDRLPGGADISVKTLAKHLPYGQCALRTTLNNLHQAGHLRRGREHLTGTSSQLWITRTWFTRTARGDDWWAAFTRGDVPTEYEAQSPAEQRSRPTRSRAFILLAALGRTAPALSLSQADCAALAPLVAEWFERGANEESVRHALTAGLPTPVHHPAALIRGRLTSKLPPEPAAVRPPLRMLECAKCGVPGRAEALAGGVCGECRGETVPPRAPSAPVAASAVHAYAATTRAALIDRRRERPRV